MNFIKKLKENVLYINIWKKEIKKEKKFESKGKMIEYLSSWYKSKTGDDLDLVNPKTFTEKQQWLKVYDSTPEKTWCADKYMVRSFIKNTIGEEYLVPIISIKGREVFYNAYDIPFESLPNSFVIQCNHGAHMTHVVKDKHKLGKRGYKKIQKKLNAELKINYAYCHGYELQYRDIKPCIFLTEYIKENTEISDYKYFYFNGEMKYFSVDQTRFSNHRRAIFDSKLNETYFQCLKYKPIDFTIDKMKCERMIELSNKLADYFDYVRVDLYSVGDKIYFSELTFSSASGIAILDPITSNMDMSSFININKIGGKTEAVYEKINL